MKTLQELKEYNRVTYQTFKTHAGLSRSLGGDVMRTGVRRFLNVCESKGG